MHNGIDGEGRDALETEFVHDVLSMCDNGGETDVKFLSNLFVDVTLYDERHNLDLAVGENFALQYLGHGRKMLATAVSMLLESE